jgi:hypothetical protein
MASRSRCQPDAAGIMNMRSLTRTGGDLVVRTSLLLAVGVGLCLRVLPASAQTFTGIGTDPFAPTEWIDAGNDADWRSQTFIAADSRLRSLSFWFDGGTRTGITDDFYSRLYINAGVGFLESPPIFAAALDQTIQGRYDFYFNDLTLTPSDSYTFSIFTNDCGPDCGADNPPGGGPPITGAFQDPQVEVTTRDAYRDGFFINGRVGPVYDRDMRFEATFVSVAEPPTWLLTGTGLLLCVGLVGWRKREQGAG